MKSKPGVRGAREPRTQNAKSEEEVYGYPVVEIKTLNSQDLLTYGQNKLVNLDFEIWPKIAGR